MGSFSKLGSLFRGLLKGIHRGFYVVVRIWIFGSFSKLGSLLKGSIRVSIRVLQGFGVVRIWIFGVWGSGFRV